MKAIFVLLSVFVLSSFALNHQTANVSSKSHNLDEGNIVMHQVCNTGQSVEVASLKKEVETLRKEVTLRLDEIEKKGTWRKLTSSPVCFGAKNNQFGRFVLPFKGLLAAVKLVHLTGSLSCASSSKSHYSNWGCGSLRGYTNQFNVVVTTSSNRILFPPASLTHPVKWYKIPGHSTTNSPELVLTDFANPASVSSGQALRVWYGEDLTDTWEGDNAGRACVDAFGWFL